MTFGASRSVGRTSSPFSTHRASLGHSFHGFHFDPDGNCVGRNPQKRSAKIESLELEAVPRRVVDRRIHVFA